jgi:glycosyltransferase involved in cell wall biosynthesis
VGIGTYDLKFQPQAAENRVLLDFSDVFFYLRHHPTVSGIQRVQLGIAKAISEMRPSKRADILFVTETEDGRKYLILEEIFIATLWKEFSGAKVEHSRLVTLMKTAVSRGSPYAPAQGDILLLLGASWVLENVAKRIIELRPQGVHAGTLIHDIIPITHPEFWEKALTDAFRMCFVSLLPAVEFILTVSDHSGHMVKTFLEMSKIHCPPIRTLRLAHKTWEAATASSISLSREVSELLKQEYVLFVSTIEIRKNHTYLFRIWKRLIQSRGKQVPCLVFVGRRGWGVDDLMAQLRFTNNLNGKVKILHDLPDMELAMLYKSALFTFFPVSKKAGDSRSERVFCSAARAWPPTQVRFLRSQAILPTTSIRSMRTTDFQDRRFHRRPQIARRPDGVLGEGIHAAVMERRCGRPH